MVLPTTLHRASVRSPLRLDSRRAASVSAVSPDCVIPKHHGVSFQRRIAITKLAGIFHFDWNPRELLEQRFADQGRMIAGAARRHDDAIDLAQLGRRPY